MGGSLAHFPLAFLGLLRESRMRLLLDKLTEKVKEANELVHICETKLRGIEKEVQEATKAATERIKKKKKN